MRKFEVLFWAKIRGENVAIELKDFRGLGPPVGAFDVVLLLGESNLLTAASSADSSLLLIRRNCCWCALKSVVMTYGHSWEAGGSFELIPTCMALLLEKRGSRAVLFPVGLRMAGAYGGWISMLGSEQLLLNVVP